MNATRDAASTHTMRAIHPLLIPSRLRGRYCASSSFFGAVNLQALLACESGTWEEEHIVDSPPESVRIHFAASFDPGKIPMPGYICTVHSTLWKDVRIMLRNVLAGGISQEAIYINTKVAWLEIPDTVASPSVQEIADNKIIEETEKAIEEQGKGPKAFTDRSKLDKRHVPRTSHDQHVAGRGAHSTGRGEGHIGPELPPPPSRTGPRARGGALNGGSSPAWRPIRRGDPRGRGPLSSRGVPRGRGQAPSRDHEPE